MKNNLLTYDYISRFESIRQKWTKIYNKDFNGSMPDEYSVDFDITSCCNYKCKCCSHCAPYSKPYFISIESFRNDLIQTVKFFEGKLRTVNILGGEPLLHPVIDEIIRIAHSICANQNIQIGLGTNATLIRSKGELFIKLCMDNNVIIQCSMYRTNFAAIDLCRRWIYKYGGKYIRYDPKLLPNGWNYVQISNSAKTIDLTTFNCEYGGCPQVYKGVVYPCSYAVYGTRLNDVLNQEYCVAYKEDGANLYSQTLADYRAILNRKCLSFCKHCNFIKRGAWGQAIDKDDYIQSWIGEVE